MQDFIALLKEIRFSSCCAIFSATSCASLSGLFTSLMSMLNLLADVSFSTCFLSASISAPPLPITTPGLAVWMIILTLSEALSISIFEIPAAYNLFLRNFLML